MKLIIGMILGIFIANAISCVSTRDVEKEMWKEAAERCLASLNASLAIQKSKNIKQ